jgi:hypothetical protein
LETIMSSPTLDAFLKARELRDSFEDMSAAEIRRLTPSEYARISGQHFGPVTEAPAPAPRAPEDHAEEIPEPQGIDTNSQEYFLAWRAQRNSGGEGKGIFDSVSSQSEAYRNAARAQSGRHGWITSNVEESPRIARITQPEVNESRLDRRPVTQRFGSPANLFQVEG